MTSPTTSDRLLRAVGRPLLLLSFALYQREIRRAPMPRDEPGATIRAYSKGENPGSESPALDSDRIAFLGDVTAAGYGVVTHEIATPAQTARQVGMRRSRTVDWHAVTDLRLRAGQIAERRAQDVLPSDVVVVMLGVTDVLFMTKPDDWVEALERLMSTVKVRSGEGCRFVLVSVPPLADLWPIQAPARQLIQHQSDRLNAATEGLARRLPGVSYAPFPAWPLDEQHAGESRSWRVMHDTRARDLAPIVVDALEMARATSAS